MFADAETTELDEATERLSGLLSALDMGLVLPASLADLVALGERIERLGHALKTTAAAAVAGTSIWRAAGVRSPQEWLAQRTGSSKTEAARLVETGRQLEQLPATAAAARRGELSARQAQAIAAAAVVDPASEGRLQCAGDRSLRELQDECARARANTQPDPHAAARQAHRARSYRTWADPDGLSGHIHLTGPTASIARIDNAIRHRTERIFRQAHREGRREPSEAYAFDATLELTTNNGDSKPVPAGADAKIIVRIDHSALTRGHTVQGETCEIVGIGPIPVATVRQWMDDAFLAAVLTKGQDVQRVVHLGRRFTASQRTALQWQHPICARKGCNNRLGLEYDHFEDWAHTHTTRTTAAKRFCRTCHQLKTSGWQVSPPDSNGQCTFTPPGHDTLAAVAAEAISAQHQRQQARRATRAQQQQLLDTG